ncbi:hypothetical protein [Streptomyces parvus]|uniref:hypothetical protein n=1 Tax=Streptomyces parvus TaxID=66428 RepID=UPI003712DE8A
MCRFESGSGHTGQIEPGGGEPRPVRDRDTVTVDAAVEGPGQHVQHPDPAKIPARQ